MKLSLQQKFWFLTIVLVASVFAVSTSAHAFKLKQNEQVLVYGMPYDFSEYSQWTADSYATAQWLSAVMAGLYQRDSKTDRNWAPDLAADAPTVSSDGLTWTVTLKSGLKFATGDPLTADDVVFTYKAALTPAINLNGYGTLSYYMNNDSISALDATTVQFKFTKNYAFAQSLLAQGIIEKAEFKADYDACVAGTADACVWNADSGNDARGAGPFMVDSIDTTNNIVTLVKNANYWDASAVHADKLIFRKISEQAAALSELGAGTIDIMDAQYVPSIDAFKTMDNVLQTMVGDPAHQEISLNHENPYFGTGAKNPAGDGTGYSAQGNASALDVRKAMSHVVNRDYYVNEVLKGLGAPAATVMPSASLGWNPDLKARTYNVTLAQQFMEQAGFDFASINYVKNTAGVWEAPTSGAGSFFNITVLSPNTNPARNTWSADYVTQLPKIGIGVTQHVSTGWDQIIPRTFGSDVNPGNYSSGGFDIFFVGYGWALDWDPTGLYSKSGLCATGDCSNFYNYSNTTVANDILKYASELNFDKRLADVKQVQQDLFDDIPVIPILYPQSNWGWQKDITGIDALLLSTSSLQWQFVSKTSWTNVPAGSTLDPRAGVTSSSGNGLPIDGAYIALAMIMSASIAFIHRRKYN